MEVKHAKDLAKFNEKPSMYVPTITEDTIVSFLHGYSHAANGSSFGEDMSDRLKEMYKIKPDATGWIGQLHKMAERDKITWVAAYFKVSNELILWTLVHK